LVFTQAAGGGTHIGRQRVASARLQISIFNLNELTQPQLFCIFSYPSVIVTLSNSPTLGIIHGWCCYGNRLEECPNAEFIVANKEVSNETKGLSMEKATQAASA
jgi:hypothetical protein